MSKSPTIIADDLWSRDPKDWLHNPSAAEILRTEFLEPLGMTVEQLAGHIDLSGERIVDLLEGRAPMDAELDLRLARYFRMSEGFFLGLQADHDLEEAKRAHGAELDRIIPRAA